MLYGYLIVTFILVITPFALARLPGDGAGVRDLSVMSVTLGLLWPLVLAALVLSAFIVLMLLVGE